MDENHMEDGKIKICAKFLWATEYLTSAWWTIVILIVLFTNH